MSLMLPPPEQYLPPYDYVSPELRLKICRLWNFAIHSIVARAMRMNMLDAKHLAQAILWTVVSVSSKHILTLQIPFVVLTVGSGNYPVGIVPLYLCVLFRNGPTKPIIPDSQLEKGQST